ncbi:hypothetical protein PN488_21205 [Nodularia spumigena CS-591/12]|uniref:hypothetical protein n=1 Tax=Nodularia spumigena TaxID=70799 RepID=UPI00232C9A5B|nr:hypothetical protein [Nodularia spumigena]MDB9306855.1 hypothetical protein [Nodularia spumigena CS-591/12]MDB9342258.1 hypothetical protein [Nodularia spumigena CS-588/06]MDB9367595.1 hypothetical protein [Nodularia spumigena CS-586/05]
MTEDAGKKKYIKDFLQQVKGGEGYIGDIWIERVIRPPSTDCKVSTANSLSGRGISNLSELIDDDLKHCFEEGYFTFRFVEALLGTGKTSLLKYLCELIKIKPTYGESSIVVNFELSKLLTSGGNQDFSVKLYCYILAQTFWKLVHNTNLSSEVKEVGLKLLGELCKEDIKNSLILTESEQNFINKFLENFHDRKFSFEDVFFNIISEVSKIAPLFTFVYLIDELDALEKYPDHIQNTRSLFRALIKKGQEKTKIRLLIYLGGTSINVNSFIAEDSVFESHVKASVISLSNYTSEYEMIREKIDKRIEGAYKGYKDFAKAWEEIQNITINPGNLRAFCKEYASSVLEIHEKYFKEVPDQVFEGNARELVKAQCEEKWKNYLRKSAYTLKDASTTTLIGGHAFDCYVELRHNGECVARAFGEAKNYELLSSHLKEFTKWLEDTNFKSSNYGGKPPDLAFMIAPSCPELLHRKLELKNIDFIQWEKVVEASSDTNHQTKNSNNQSQSYSTEKPNTVVLNYLPTSSVELAWKIFTFISEENNQQITLEELKRKYESFQLPLSEVNLNSDSSSTKSIEHPLGVLKRFSLINCGDQLIKVSESLQSYDPLTIANSLSNILIDHIVVKTFFNKKNKGEYMERSEFEEMLVEVCHFNKPKTRNTIRSNSIRLIYWLEFAGIIEYQSVSRQSGFIYRPIGEGKNKGKLPDIQKGMW